ncbi:MAG: histidine kinase [Lachnospiraceae bacterium]|nr:histidine kinase [Lachnospiraceae bacterium]MBD5481621.1 histidine kinase [Lachnospiraceae bacterium]
MKWFHRAKLSRQLSVISCFFILIPTLILWYSMMSSAQNTAIRTREQEAGLRRTQLVTEAERIAELCNLSTQVFLNTPALMNHLTALEQGYPIDSMKLLEFYREDIAGLEKIIISNPELYQIRVYSSKEDIYEMMPILYSARRLTRMPWAGEEIVSGTWYMDYTEQFFADSSPTEHVMSLITDISAPFVGNVGTLEVSVRMDEVMPELFEENGYSFSVLLSEDGELLAGGCPVSAESLAEIPYTEEILVHRVEGHRALIAQSDLKVFGCRYMHVLYLSDLDRSILKEAILLFVLLLIAFALMVFIISRLTRKMLRGFYRAFDGMRAFANGDIDAVVDVSGEGEVALFAKELGGLLDKIRQLMRDNLEQERLAQSLEIRALHNQINAHFIYNVLEAIKMMAEIDEEYEIADAVTSLGKLLRYSMKWEKRNVMLRREIEYIENYITLMNLRYDYVISLEVDVPEELLIQRIPKISLQPVVENAVIHGAVLLGADTTISVRGRLDAERSRVLIMITDEGAGMDEEALSGLRRQITGEETAHSSSGNGIGLHNVHSRIRRSFGEEYGLEVDSKLHVGTTVTISLPYQVREENVN